MAGTEHLQQEVETYSLRPPWTYTRMHLGPQQEIINGDIFDVNLYLKIERSLQSRGLPVDITYVSELPNPYKRMCRSFGGRLLQLAEDRSEFGQMERDKGKLAIWAIVESSHDALKIVKTVYASPEIQTLDRALTFPDICAGAAELGPFMEQELNQLDVCQWDTSTKRLIIGAFVTNKAEAMLEVAHLLRKVFVGTPLNTDSADNILKNVGFLNQILTKRADLRKQRDEVLNGLTPLDEGSINGLIDQVVERVLKNGIQMDLMVSRRIRLQDTV